MYSPSHIYAYDIETDNSAGHGLDPYNSRVTEVALATQQEVYVLNGDEATILEDFASLLDDLPTGLLGTWNGLFFDNPFLKIRAQLTEHRIDSSLLLLPQPGLTPKYDYLPGVSSAQSLVYNRPAGAPHTHLDISLPWKAFAESFGTHVVDGKTRPVVPWSLKPVAKAAGIEMVEIDRTRLHDYTQAEVNAYVGSDATGTRALILKTFGLTD